MCANLHEDPTDPNNLKAMHSIEAILGIKAGEQHHAFGFPSAHQFPPQHLLLASASYAHQHGSGAENKKQRHYADGKPARRTSDETEALSSSKSNGNSDDDLIDDDDDSDSHDQSTSHGGSNSKKKHRRNRTTFTTFQLHELERAFEKSRKCD